MMFNHPIPPPSPGIPKPPFPFQWQGTGAANGAESASKQFLHTHDVPVETQTLADAEAAAAGETTPVAEVQVQVQAPAPAGEVRVPPAGPLTGRNLHTAAWGLDFATQAAQDWIFECLQGGRAQLLAACGVDHALLPSDASTSEPQVRESSSDGLGADSGLRALSAHR
jgi:hypothetical protein